MASWFAEVDEWGIPNWKNPGAYGATEDWDLSRWRWEFTRRREDYRDDFEKALSSVTDPLELPVDIIAEDALCYRPIRAWPFFHEGAPKYGLKEFFDPVLSDWIGIGPEWNSGLIIGSLGFDYKRTEKGEDEFVELEAEYMSCLTFDLRRPLNEQLREAKAFLESEQYHWLLYGQGREELYPAGGELTFLENPEGRVRKPKLHKTLWLVYLRVLDAKAQEATLSEIAQILPEHIGTRDSKAADNVLDQAQKQAFRF